MLCVCFIGLFSRRKSTRHVLAGTAIILTGETGTDTLWWDKLYFFGGGNMYRHVMAGKAINFGGGNMYRHVLARALLTFDYYLIFSFTCVDHNEVHLLLKKHFFIIIIYFSFETQQLLE